MNFICVNGRTPHPRTFCMLCLSPIGTSYLREIRTRFPFCDHRCYALLRQSSAALLQDGPILPARALEKRAEPSS
ncbi:hypothetical protein [Bradyrhizobium sp. ARR65]|uniref:hypothetical protein n=1 Tax=Bradyrhizobium sp. ARR65 TaxID=1040989 RepID=UPI000465C1A4|nr:hypothetical protein [Bradyrhizobium sp. ARR65]